MYLLLHFWILALLWFHTQLLLLLLFPRFSWTPAAFSWATSRLVSTRRRPLRPLGVTPFTRCVSAQVVRSTCRQQRAAPPARPWATSACGADLGGLPSRLRLKLLQLLMRPEKLQRWIQEVLEDSSVSLVFETQSLFFYLGIAVDTECLWSGEKKHVITLEILGCRRDMKAQICQPPHPLDVFWNKWKKFQI